MARRCCGWIGLPWVHGQIGIDPWMGTGCVHFVVADFFFFSSLWWLIAGGNPRAEVMGDWIFVMEWVINCSGQLIMVMVLGQRRWWARAVLWVVSEVHGKRDMATVNFVVNWRIDLLLPWFELIVNCRTSLNRQRGGEKNGRGLMQLEW
jgi:hypothetical protein